MVHTRAITPREEVLPHMDAHLAYQIKLESELAGLSPILFRQSPTLLPAEDHMRLWTALVEASNKIDAILKTAKLASTTNFSPLLFACACSPTYEIAAERLRAFKLLLGPLCLRVEHDDRCFTVTPVPAPELDRLPGSLATAEVAFQKMLIDVCTRSCIQPARVILPDDLAADQRIVEFFGVRPLVGTHASISFTLKDARRPFLTQESSMWEYLEPELRRRLSTIENVDSTVELARAALLELLPAGESSISAVAKHLAMSSRTLQRRLDQEGTAYKTVLSNLRSDLAEDYLSKDLSPPEVAFLLAYSEVNSFLRAFKGWKGMTPDQYQKQSLH